MSDRVRLAAVDIGTVTTRLLIADVADDEIVEVERSTDITHLGEGLDASGSLSPAAMARVVEVVAGYADRAESSGVQRVGAVATSASRDAANSAEFLSALGEAGIVPEIIEGRREAELTFSGATFGMHAGAVLVDDIGGGSTELVFGVATRPERKHRGSGDTSARSRITSARSFDVGSRRMTERYLTSDPPTRAQLDRARAEITEAMRPYFDAVDGRPDEVISVAGTATSLAAIELELAVYDSAVVHGYRLGSASVSELAERLAGMPLEQRRRVPGLHPGRAGVIVAGALILESVLALAGTDSTVVSEHDILYGILLDTLRRNGAVEA